MELSILTAEEARLMNGEFLRGLLTALVGAGLMLVMSGCTVDDGEADCACAPGQTAVEASVTQTLMSPVRMAKTQP